MVPQTVKKILNLQSKEQIDIDKYNDKQIEQVMEMHLQMQEKQLQLDKEYYQALKQILPVKKIFLLHQAEKEFKKKMLRDIKNHNGK